MGDQELMGGSSPIGVPPNEVGFFEDDAADGAGVKINAEAKTTKKPLPQYGCQTERPGVDQPNSRNFT